MKTNVKIWLNIINSRNQYKQTGNRKKRRKKKHIDNRQATLNNNMSSCQPYNSPSLGHTTQQTSQKFQHVVGPTQLQVMLSFTLRAYSALITISSQESIILTLSSYKRRSQVESRFKTRNKLITTKALKIKMKERKKLI